MPKNKFIKNLFKGPKRVITYYKHRTEHVSNIKQNIYAYSRFVIHEKPGIGGGLWYGPKIVWQTVR